MNRPISNERFVYFNYGRCWTIVRIGKNADGHDITWPFPNTDRRTITTANEQEAEKTARSLAFLTDSTYQKGSN